MEKASECPLSVLIVDDDPGLREALTDLLSLEGHCVETAGSGIEASRCLAEQVFDMLLLDVDMPEMNGIELLSHMRHHGCTIPVVLMTGCQIPGIMAQAISLGVSGILGKPFMTDDLLIEVRRISRDVARGLQRAAATADQLDRLDSVSDRR
jgi:DNA-binding NtrC family response regulator